MDSDTASPAELDADERAALHRVELGVEWLHRAHGNLLAFHHNVGRAMNYLAAAEPALRESGHDELADVIRDERLPQGVVGDRWSYDVVECFERGMLADVTDFEATVREHVADGQRHVGERVQEEAWRRRAREEPD